MRISRPLLVLLTALVLSAACAPTQTVPTPTPILTTPNLPPPDPRANPGSLFDAAQNRLLFEDDRARRVGDIVMVRVVENSSGKHTADTNAEKEASYTISADAYFGNGQMRALPFNLPTGGLNGQVGDSPMLNTSSTSKHDATGETGRDADLTATVGARVVRVLPGEILEVEGARQLRINNETQVLVVRGLLRIRDIGPNNAITSDHLANAHIEYYGQGVLADKQKPGWLARILDNVWPF